MHNDILSLLFSFMKPLLTNHIPPLTETMPRCCFPITKLLTTKEQEGLVSYEIL